MNRRHFLSTTAAAGLASLPLGLRAQQDYPSQSVRLIIPFAPGGQTDILARLYSQHMGTITGQTFIPENRAGAGGSVGSVSVMRAKPDGYTLLMATSSSHAISPQIMDPRPYDVEKDFTPISLLAIIPMVIVVHPSFPAKTLEELVAIVKAEPGQHNYGSAGIGSINHLAGEMLKSEAKLPGLVHVPYKGTGQSLQDLVGGQIKIATTTFSSVLDHARSGRLRILAVCAEKRSAAAPEVPTTGEAGYPGVISATYNMICGPAGMPEAVVKKLASDSHTFINNPELKLQLQKGLIEPVTDSTPQSAREFLIREYQRLTPIIKASRTDQRA